MPMHYFAIIYKGECIASLTRRPKSGLLRPAAFYVPKSKGPRIRVKTENFETICFLRRDFGTKV